jgi:hypothetical protein
MPQNPKNRAALFRKQCGVMAAAAAAVALVTTGASAWAPDDQDAPVVQLFTIPVPVASTNTTGGMYGFDISFVDSTTETYYLGDRSNAAVDVVDAKTGTFIKQITASPPFAGVKLNTAGTAVNNNISGPNGVVATDTCLFAGDGPSRVVSFTLPSGTQVSSVNTGGSFRADEMAYDPQDSVLLVANNAETIPFATLISVGSGCELTIGKRITFTTATNGAEQAVWNPADDRFYQSIPSISGTTSAPGTTGAIFRINPLTASVEAQFLVDDCMPAGLALGPKQTFLAGCSVVYDTEFNPWFGADTDSANPLQAIVDIKNGNVTYVQGVGSSDEVWFNPGDDRFYTASQNSPYSPHPVAGTSGALSTTDEGAGILGVIDADDKSLAQLVPTLDVPAVLPLLGPPPGHPSGSSHSVAANAANNWVFVPLPANNAVFGCLTGCIAVYGQADIDHHHHHHD